MTAVLVLVVLALATAVITARDAIAIRNGGRLTPPVIRLALANVGRWLTEWAEREDVIGETLVAGVKREFDGFHIRDDARVIRYKRRMRHLTVVRR